ncbi:MAG: hypothetical protein DRN20_02115 [Thermoplasmata archaeon]|nr:MAG: hypothetical protein DRN20_02115 [Thermoplasmata archaeon]
MTEFDLKDLGRKSVLVMAYNVFGAFSGYVALFFVFRYIGPGTWGIVGSATALVGLLTIFTDLGLSRSTGAAIATLVSYSVGSYTTSMR